MTRVGGDLNLLREIAGLFLKECPGLMTQIQDAIVAGDASRLRRAAHTLKGAVGNFGAIPTFEAALKLEMMGQSGDLHAAKEACLALEAEIASLKPAMTEAGQMIALPREVKLVIYLPRGKKLPKFSEDFGSLETFQFCYEPEA